MGCGASKVFNWKLFVTETAPEITLARIQEAIKKNDLFLFEKHEGIKHISENFGMPGESTTCLHLAAEFDAYNIIEHVLQYIVGNIPAKFASIVNIQDKLSHTPAMIAVMKDHFFSFSKLFEYNACDFILKDREGKNLKKYLNNAPMCKAYFDKNTQSKPTPRVENPNEKDSARINKVVAVTVDPNQKSPRKEQEKPKKEEEKPKQEQVNPPVQKVEVPKAEEISPQKKQEEHKEEKKVEQPPKKESIIVQQEALREYLLAEQNDPKNQPNPKQENNPQSPPTKDPKKTESIEKPKETEIKTIQVKPTQDTNPKVTDNKTDQQNTNQQATDKSKQTAPNQNPTDNTDLRTKFVPLDSKVYPVLKSCIDTNQVFTDTEFPAVLESITKDVNHKYYNLKFTPAVWLRPHEFLNTTYDKIKVFDTVDPNDIVQGCLGTCYFLASLASMAEFPTRLMESFLTRNINELGIYGLRFYIYGVPTEVIIDDRIPCLNKVPLFTRSKEKEIWVILLEKAWAKIFKHYTAAESGNAGWALSCITKAPAFGINLAEISAEDVFKTVLEADQKNWIMTASCVIAEAEKQKELGLVSSHAYSLLGAYDFGEVKLFKLRNPWGSGEFKGDYSDNSAKWTDEMKKKVGLVQANDGMFFITVQDFKLYFGFLQICQYQDNWFYSYASINKEPRHATYHEFEITELTLASFKLHQPDVKTYIDDQPDYKASRGEMIVALVLPNGTLQDLVPKGEKGFAEDTYGVMYLRKDKKAVELQPGKYVIRSKMHWFDDKKKPCTVSVYSSKKIELVERKTKFENYFEKLFINTAQKEEKIALKEGVSILKTNYRNDLYYYYDKSRP